MSQRSVSQQVMMEHEMLSHVRGALRTILDWKIQEYDLSRKLASLMFITEAFHRHLERVIELEESQDLLNVLASLHPHLSRQAESLRKDHVQFKRVMEQVMPRLERIAASDHATLGMLCEELRVLLNRFDEQSGKEAELIEDLVLAGLTEENGETFRR